MQLQSFYQNLVLKAALIPWFLCHCIGYYIKSTERHSWPDVCTSLCCSRTMTAMAAGQTYALPLFVYCCQDGRWNSLFFFLNGNVLFLPVSLWNENAALLAPWLPTIVIYHCNNPNPYLSKKHLSCSCSGGCKEKENHIWEIPKDWGAVEWGEVIYPLFPFFL